MESALSRALSSLNPSQRVAATHIDGAMLILAGAGSGKTKTITTRLAYLIDEVGIPPSNTLTLTFTNKAATEMRDRALSLLEHSDNAPPLLCTFHKFGLLFLRLYISALGREANFVVLDSADKKLIIKSLSKALPVSMFDTYISSAKNSFLSPSECLSYALDRESKLCHKVYCEYEQYLESKNLLDFDDLLYLTYKILCQKQDIAKQVSQKYQYIMVDEYQDTNEIQAKILKSLCIASENLCVVGDDDQSIYGWRGADINNILHFSQVFKNVQVVKLEDNYRSSEQILNVANRLIAHNKQRLGKNLNSIKGEGEEVHLRVSDSETQEAEFLAKEIKRITTLGISFSEIAILFRLNALSRSIEEGLNRAKIPYKIIGAMRFYERAEIKDILSYLRVIVNFDDDFSFLRIINRPKRGIGSVSQKALENLSTSKSLSCIATLLQYKEEAKKALGEKPYNALMSLIEDFKRWRAYTDLSDVITDMEKHIVFTFSPLDEVDREGNIKEFYGKFRDYAINNPHGQIEDFLNDLALANPLDEVIGDAINCMSVHTAKGLEFKYVFVIGLEQGFFPLSRDDDSIQEERRLCYVAITRAKDVLTLCYAKSRLYNGRREHLKPSIFLKESGLLGESKVASSYNYAESDTFAKGELVRHKIFGVGIIESVSGEGTQCKLKINFGGLMRDILSKFVQKVE